MFSSHRDPFIYDFAAASRAVGTALARWQGWVVDVNIYIPSFVIRQHPSLFFMFKTSPFPYAWLIFLGTIR